MRDQRNIDRVIQHQVLQIFSEWPTHKTHVRTTANSIHATQTYASDVCKFLATYVHTYTSVMHANHSTTDQSTETHNISIHASPQTTHTGCEKHQPSHFSTPYKLSINLYMPTVPVGTTAGTLILFAVAMTMLCAYLALCVI